MDYIYELEILWSEVERCYDAEERQEILKEIHKIQKKLDAELKKMKEET